VSDVAQIMRDLEDSARGLDAAATKLAKLTKEFDGPEGLQLRWEDAVLDAIEAVYAEYERDEKKAPAREIVERKAARRARQARPELHADYTRAAAEMAALKGWISAKKETISARQSVLSAEKALLAPVGRA
jgi:hypothetical protein